MDKLEKEQDIDTTHATLYQFLKAIRLPEEIRSKLDIGYQFKAGVVEFFEIRPDWIDETIIRHHPFAKLRYVKSQQVWKLYWLRASGKWESYSPFPQSHALEPLLDCIGEDKHHCFFG